MMTKQERLKATFAGEPVDRVAVSLWRHFPGDDQRAEDLALATIAFQRTNDWDFIKVSPASSFCIRDWGVVDEWVGGDEGDRQYRRRAILNPADWTALPALDPTAGSLGSQLRCLRIIAADAGSEIPFIQTIFSPLAQAKNLAGAEHLLVHLRECPDKVHAGLETITQTTIGFIEACASTGMSGIYYAAQLASYRSMSDAEYRQFGEPYDRRILAAAAGFWFNMLHAHGEDVMFDLLAQYPVHAINWHDRESEPSLKDGQSRFRGAVCGGLSRWDDLLRGDPDRVRSRVVDAITQTGGRRLIVASGCVSPVTAPWGNLRAVRQAVEK